MTFNWGNLPSQMGGYNQLTENLEDVPDDYQKLVRKLNYTYRSPKEWVDLYTEQTQNLALGYKVFLTNNHPWYSDDSFNNEISPIQIEYYKNNPKFKNRVMESMDAMSGLMWAHSSFRGSITENYVLINDLLGDKVKTQPNKIRKTSLITEHDAQKYIGTYDEESNAPNGQTIEITAEGKDLYFTNAIEKRRLLYFHNEKPWFGFNNSSSLIMFDGEENNTLRLITGRQKTAVYRRRISQ